MYSFKPAIRSLYLVAICILTSCDDPEYVPKPRGFFKIDLPKKTYLPFNREGYPYQFEYPGYAIVEKDSMFFDEKTENPWWINLDIESLNAKIYLSYKEIKGKNSLASLLNDSYNLSHYHSKKASFINEKNAFHTANNVHGLYYEVGGNAASALQFFATDSQKHFIRGALYFNATPNVDSLKPVNDFLRLDIEHLINTLNWTR
jgi:gliding motility-associated lipoprotein GldD